MPDRKELERKALEISDILGDTISKQNVSRIAESKLNQYIEEREYDAHIDTVSKEASNYFTGYTRAQDKNQLAYLNSDQWPELAKRVIEQKRLAILNSLSLDLVQAIASEEIDLNQIIEEALGAE